MTDIDVKTLLGIKLNHKDPKNKNYRAAMATTVHSVRHKYYGKHLAQWVGSCGGHSGAEALNSQGIHRPRSKHKTNDDAMRYYTRATEIDPFPGSYPKQDTGTSLTAVGNALVEFGEIESFDWTFSYEQFQAGLMLKPMVVGTEWRDDMFQTDGKGFIHVSGDYAGGHAWLVLAYSAMYDYYTMIQSWPLPWGHKGTGFARVSGPDMKKLIERDGESATYTVK